jgi:hypothetical protein
MRFYEIEVVATDRAGIIGVKDVYTAIVVLSKDFDAASCCNRKWIRIYIMHAVPLSGIKEKASAKLPVA